MYTTSSMNFLKSFFYCEIGLQHAAIGLIIPVLIIFQHSQGLSFLEIGFIQAVGFFTLLFSEVPSSYIADIWSKKNILIVGLCFLALSFLIISFADTFFLFLVSEILFSFGLSFLSGTEESFLLSMFHTKKTELLLRDFQIADEVGTICGMVLSYVLLSLLHLTIQHTFIVAFLLVLFSIGIVFTLPSIREDSTHEIIDSKWSPATSKLLLLLIMVFIIAGGLMQERGESVFQLVLEKSGIAVGLFGMVYAIAKIGSLIGSYFSSFFILSLGRNNVIVGSALLQAIVFFLLLFLNPILSTVALFCFFFVENIYRISYKSIIADSVPKKWLTSSFSAVSFGGALLLLATKMPIGFLLDEAVQYAIYFMIAIKIIVGLLFFWNLPRLKQALPRE